MQAFVIGRAVVPALDAVRYVAEAKAIARVGLVGGLFQLADDRPLYPASIAAVHAVLEPWLGPRRDGWALAAQVAGAIPLVLAAPLVYAIALRLVDRRAALVAGLLFCLLPEVARLGADGLADSPGLLLFAIAVWAIMLGAPRSRSQCGTAGSSSSVCSRSTLLDKPAVPHGRGHVRSRSTLLRPTALAVGARPAVPHGGRSTTACLAALVGGSATALALWNGPEILILLPALLVTLSACGLRRASRAEFPAWRLLAVCYGVGFLLAIGAWRVGAEYLSTAALAPSESTGAAAARLPVKETTTSIRFVGYFAALRAMTSELPRLFHYALLPLAAWGYLAARRIGPAQEANRFAATLVCVYVAAVFLHAARVGFLESRHFAPLVLVVLPWCGAGALDAADALSHLMSRWRSRSEVARASNAVVARWQVAMAAVLALLCAAQTARPLHARRVTHRQAAEWLARDARQGDVVLDSRGWTGLYSGLTSYRFAESGAALAEPQLKYLVVERHELGYDSPRSRAVVELLSGRADEAARFDSPSGDSGQDVLVYRWRLAPAVALNQAPRETPHAR